MTRSHRTTVAPGIYRDAFGYSICTKVQGVQLERRYALNSDLDKLKAIRANWIVERRQGVPVAHAFAATAADFLATFPRKSRRWVDAENAISHWLKAGLGRLPLDALTPERIATQLAAWKAAGAASSTLRHRRRELSNLFTWRYGLGGINPVRAVPRPPTTRRDRPRDFPYVVGRLILFCMKRDSLTKIRLRVMLETGWPHMVLARLEARDLHLATRSAYIVPRRKGKGVPGRKVPLSRRATAALRAFHQADAYGSFSTSSMRASFILARDRARAIWEAHDWKESTPWPAADDLHPYDFRHAFIARTVRKHGIEAASYLAIHADISQTAAYDVEQALYRLAVDATKD
jgi:integrase